MRERKFKTFKINSEGRGWTMEALKEQNTIGKLKQKTYEQNKLSKIKTKQQNSKIKNKKTITKTKHKINIKNPQQTVKKNIKIPQ